MMQNMGAIMAEVQRLQQELKNMTIEVNEGDGAVRVVMNGHQEVFGVKISSDAVKQENLEVLEIMIASAFNKAISDSKQILKNEIAKLTGGMNFPNFPGL
ncbi:MAG: YbaB/EbfC family nucleoid-associated protein [Firmicutes bacterium]|nr:YbaB/EbfC family nucleoid-associated protein [Bacillota bacterium]